MKRLFRTQRVRYCAVVTALFAVSLLAGVQCDSYSSTRSEHVRTEAVCATELHCDDTSWGG
ncbi:hypothetical protein [Streptomyces sp. NPDC005784]|uniref:hypothetical protein n=1 Tax=Streptomyces sp. NPDC005784 TaxID=3364731 RepID=UPI003683EBEE